MPATLVFCVCSFVSSYFLSFLLALQFLVFGKRDLFVAFKFSCSPYFLSDCPFQGFVFLECFSFSHCFHFYILSRVARLETSVNFRESISEVAYSSHLA